MKQDPHTIKISAYIDDATRKKLCVFLLLFFFFQRMCFLIHLSEGPPCCQINVQNTVAHV